MRDNDTWQKRENTKFDMLCYVMFCCYVKLVLHSVDVRSIQYSGITFLEFHGLLKTRLFC